MQLEDRLQFQPAQRLRLRLGVTVGLASYRHSLDRPSFGEPGRLEKKGANIIRSRDQETINRYNHENDCVSTSMQCARAGVRRVS